MVNGYEISITDLENGKPVSVTILRNGRPFHLVYQCRQKINRCQTDLMGDGIIGYCGKCQPWCVHIGGWLL